MSEIYFDYHEPEFNGFPAGWKIVAEVDESEGYDVDQTRIYQTDDGFALAVASGCSCWAGDWEVERFATIEEVFASFKTTDYTYNPSLKGIEDLQKQINENLPKGT